MKSDGANQERGQAKNRELVLRTLQHLKVCSRAELAKQTDLKPATITNIMSNFISWGLVEETGLTTGDKGRRSIGVRLSESKYRIIGFRLTRHHYSIGVFSLNGTEIGQRIFKPIMEANPMLILDEVCQQINYIIKSAKREVYLAVGVAVPGPYYSDTGEIAVISDFPGWKNIKIRDILQKNICIPVVIEHDANAGALAEVYLDERSSIYDTTVYISAGQGIGAGILNKGTIYSGTMGVAGEIGHTCIDINGPKCECGGKGCLTLYASTIALVKRFQTVFGNDNLKYKDVVKLIASSDEKAMLVFNEFMQYLCVGVNNIIYYYNPKSIVIGDELTEIGELLIDKLKHSLLNMNDSRLLSQVKIQQAKLGYDSAYIGSAIVASHYVFENVTSFFNA